jgi:hypothetical protein
MVSPTILRPRDRPRGRAFDLGAPANSNEPLPPHRQEAISDVLARLSLGDPEQRLTLAILRREFGPRAFGLPILVFALPNLLPVTVPGVSIVTGAALIFFTFQLAVGHAEPYLPRWLMRCGFTRGQLARIVARLDPVLRRIEGLVTHRLPALMSVNGTRAIAAVSFLLSFVLLLPIPFATALPASAIALLALALVGGDGTLAIAGYAVVAVTAWFFPTLVMTGLTVAGDLWQRLVAG